MDLNLELYLYPDVIVHVFYAITIIVLIAIAGKIAITSINKKQKIKEVEKDDNRGNQKRSTKTDVHESR